MALLSLPDEDLLRVLHYLSTPDLLSCRAVCLRLRDLALRPELWRRRSFEFGEPSSSRSVEAAVLRTVPCASRLSTWSEDGVSSTLRDLGALAATTRCAAAELGLRLDGDPASLATAALTIRNQAALGQLRTLHVDLTDCEASDENAPFLALLLAVVFSTEGLTWLVVQSDRHMVMTREVARGAPTALVPASLEELHLSLGDSDPRYVQFLLRSHAATLQVVEIRGEYRGHRVAPLLAAIPGLSHLECPVLDDLSLVAGCASLHSLKLIVRHYKDRAAEVASQTTAAAFLRAATQVVELELRYMNGNFVPVDQGLLTALSSSGRSALRKLDVTYVTHPVLISRLEMELVMALPGLPALEWLILPNMVSWRVLDSIRPDTVPRLRGLNIPGHYRATEALCAHAAMHEPEVRRLLARFPRLYLAVRARSCSGQQLCEHCVTGCHDVPWPADEVVVGFYTHHMPGQDEVNGLSWTAGRCNKWIKV